MSYIDSMRKGATKPNSLEERLERRIARKRGDVFRKEGFYAIRARVRRAKLEVKCRFPA
jgi:hypothetical protein